MPDSLICSSVSDYVECRNCAFVLRAQAAPDPKPQHWDSCPGCGTAEFERIDRESQDTLRTPVSGRLPDMGG